MQIFNGKVVCPRCDGNGLIYKARIVDLGINLYTCDECDATWEDSKNIRIETFQDLQTYIKGHNSSYSDEKIISLGYDWLSDE
jgi:transposase-like protein